MEWICILGRNLICLAIRGGNSEFQSLVSQTFKWAEQSCFFPLPPAPKGRNPKITAKQRAHEIQKGLICWYIYFWRRCLAICIVFAWPWVWVDVNWAALNQGEGSNSWKLSAGAHPCPGNWLNSVWSNMAIKPWIYMVRSLDCSL